MKKKSKGKVIERVLKGKNLKYAMRQVIANKGSAGIDGMPVKVLKDFTVEQLRNIQTAITTHRYKAQPIKGVTIPKSNGKTRLLGIPTVTDRWLQQAVNQTLMPIFDPEFAEQSYGFRPNRNAHQAILKAKRWINEGYEYIVDIDLASFFDEVDHVLLLNLLYQKIKCATTLRLIRKWLKAPINIGGKLIKRNKGVPQGSPLSPLLSNVLLNELDKWLIKQGAKFVRYADDFSIYCKDRKTAKQMGNRTYFFLKNKLNLPINRDKSGIRRPRQFTILGYTFMGSKEGDKFKLMVSEKSWIKLRKELKEATRKSRPFSIAERISKLKQIQRGWLNYFREADICKILTKTDRWVRNRLRACIWFFWKVPEKRRRSLLRLGAKRKCVYVWSRTRMGTWAVANSPILQTTITLKSLKMKGYQSLTELYLKASPKQNEPLYTRSVRTVV